MAHFKSMRREAETRELHSRRKQGRSEVDIIGTLEGSLRSFHHKWNEKNEIYKLKTVRNSAIQIETNTAPSLSDIESRIDKS